ncbi:MULTISPECIES: NmrA family NAD(P)-binding protein [unclassified Crossiella]|uniref:NmrA family NAD(P)-binding protein n=1 Tax=unclassified Crossiella TaxID=2620835 RepID=UPI001FFEBE76|nr:MULTISPECIES: NmrA family NAD(P)-binding protein [unclassified Crossiella]MCK2238533.1 NmrA family NAD(P)-binding protein [Crossiella sp. S99.2]MCK2251897.1 NmrA family NAD(P)-binding protein [Crossiella sp. S99.1]
MTYLVHGATGAQGGPVAALLKATGHDVRPLTRAVAQLDDIPSLTSAYAGVEAAFIHFPITPDPAAPGRWAKALATAVLAAKPRQVVISTSGGVGDDRLAAISGLAAELRAGGVPATLLAPRLFRENLLLPPIQDRLRAEDTLVYPVRADQPIAWVSHLDVAEAAVAALTQANPPEEVHLGETVTGPELAAGFAAHHGRPVRYQQLTPAEFQVLLAPLLGEAAAAGVAASYGDIATLPHLSFPAEQGGKALLGAEPRGTAAWLAELGIPA